MLIVSHLEMTLNEIHLISSMYRTTVVLIVSHLEMMLNEIHLISSMYRTIVVLIVSHLEMNEVYQSML